MKSANNEISVSLLKYTHIDQKGTSWMDCTMLIASYLRNTL